MPGLWAAVTITCGIKYRNPPPPPHIYRVRIQKSFSQIQVVYDMKFRVKPIYIVPISVALVITHPSKVMYREKRKASCQHLNFFETL